MIAAHQRHEEAEHGGFDQAGDDVAELEILLRAGEIGGRVEAEPVDRNEIPAKDPDDVGDHDQERQGHQPGNQARQHQIAQRVGRQGGQRIDLVGDPHRADLGRHRRPDPAGDHQPGDHRPEFAGDRQHDDGRYRALGGKAAEPGVGLERQNHAGKDRGEPNHWQREVADLDHLAQQRARIERRRDRRRQRGSGKDRDPPGRAKETEKRGADRGKKLDHSGSVLDCGDMLDCEAVGAPR